MVTNEDNNDFKDIRDLLKKHYNTTEHLDSDVFWENISKKIESLFHKEIFSNKLIDGTGNILSDEERYYLGLEEYINNEINALKHKTITDHLLKCSECRGHYNNVLNKKKTVSKLVVNL